MEIIASQAIGCFYIGFMHWMSGHSKGPRKVPNREPIVPIQPTVIALPLPAKRAQVRAWVAALVLPLALAGAAVPAHAVDGCLVLLCLAAPSWRAIPQCVPPITQVLRDLARGRPFPTCGMAGAGNSASHQWASAPGNCPWQYTYAYETENSIGYSCGFSGVVSIQIDGAPWARTWWSMGGDSVTEFLPAAKARLGNWDSRFDDELAARMATVPPAAEPCPTC
jgi:hypothetical protein